MAEDEYLTLEEVARLLKVPLETVRTWRKRRPDFPGGRVGRHVRVPRRKLEAWIAYQLGETKVAR